ncbi:Uroporphyrinogen decarboxylase [Carabus blaptoides fortunei]
MSSSGKNFPGLKNDRFLRACRGEQVDRVPVWIMRQAGRYLPEFQEFRKQHDFFTICRTPSLACEVTLMPIRRYAFDAAIIFSDILVVPQALGMEVLMVAGTGPVLTSPLETPSDFTKLNLEGVINRLQYVGEAITLTRQCLEGKVPLIGFSGAPWTLMGYMIEGGGSKTMMKAKKWLYKYPKESHNLLTILSDIIIDYLLMQVEAGAQVLQVFESSAEFLNADLFEQFLLPYLKHIRTTVKSRLKSLQMDDVPMILFAKGAHYSLAEQAKLGYEVLGVDWTVDPLEARKLVGPDITLQGNLDPCALYGSEETIKKLTSNMIKKFTKDKYIANLGHGIYPDASPKHVEYFLDAIQNA